MSVVHSGETLLAGHRRPAYGDRVADDPQPQLRVSRLENDTAAIYELLSGIQTTQQEHSRRFDAVDRRFDAVEATLAEVVRRLPEPS